MAFKTAASWLRERFALGSAAAPSITFAGDTNTGVYSPGADQVGIATAGTARARWSNGNAYNLTTATGSTGFYNDNGTSVNGFSSDFNANVTYLDAESTLVCRDVDNGYAEHFRVGSGLLALNGDTDTFISNPAANALGFTTNNTERLRIDSTGQLTTGTGSAAAPVLSFSGDTNTGIYSPGADQVGIATAGTAILYVVAAGNVGIGTATPSSKLDVNGTINASALTINGAAVTTTDVVTSFLLMGA